MTATLAGIGCGIALHPWLDRVLDGRYPFFAYFAGFLMTLALAGPRWSLVTLVVGFVVATTGSFEWALAFIAFLAVIGALSYIFLLGDVKRVEYNGE